MGRRKKEGGGETRMSKTLSRRLEVGEWMKLNEFFEIERQPAQLGNRWTALDSR
jgi:hypothetical protein